MSLRTCSIDDCEDRHRARGWCHRHYQRWLDCGSPLGRHHRPMGWGRRLVCDCEPARAGGPYGSCRICGLPIVALMHQHLRERMAELAPESVTQRVQYLEQAA